MMHSMRTAAAAVLLLLATAVPAAAQESAALATPAWDARLTPTPVAPRTAALSAAAVPRQVKGAGLMVLGAAGMYATRQMEGEDGEDGVPFLPLITGAMGALSFWYGLYQIVHG
jgi:quinol-cytochrome oxidoreductase complex cytochrome b subunit